MTFDINAVLNSASKKETSKSKSKIPVLPTPEELKPKCTRIAELVGILDSSKAEKEVLEAEVLTWSSKEREALIIRQGFIGSVKVEGLKEIITLSWQDKYSKVDIENLPLIEAVIGDKAKEFFSVQNSISVKADATDEELNELIGLVGAERFGKFFEVSRTVKPSTRYTTERFTAFTPDQRQQLDLIVKQYKPAVKTK